MLWQVYKDQEVPSPYHCIRLFGTICSGETSFLFFLKMLVKSKKICLQYKIWLKPTAEQQFVYGNHIMKSGLGRISESTAKYQGVVVYNMADIPLVGVTFSSSLTQVLENNRNYFKGLWSCGKGNVRMQTCWANGYRMLSSSRCGRIHPSWRHACGLNSVH